MRAGHPPRVGAHRTVRLLHRHERLLSIAALVVCLAPACTADGVTSAPATGSGGSTRGGFESSVGGSRTPAGAAILPGKRSEGAQASASDGKGAEARGPAERLVFRVRQFESLPGGSWVEDPRGSGTDVWRISRPGAGAQHIERSGVSLSYDGHERFEFERRGGAAHLTTFAEVRENEHSEGSTAVTCEPDSPVLFWPAADERPSAWTAMLACDEPPHRFLRGEVVRSARLFAPGEPQLAVRISLTYAPSLAPPNDPSPAFVWTFWFDDSESLPSAYRSEYRSSAGYRIAYEADLRQQ